jgi:hypothetical protein
MGGKLERRERTRKNTGEKEAEEWDIMVFTFIVEERILWRMALLATTSRSTGQCPSIRGKYQIR